jgi:ankyrin repeat protein
MCGLSKEDERVVPCTTVDLILGPGLIQSTILKYLDNIYCLKEVQAWVSLHALGFVSREDLKQHLTKKGKLTPFLPPSNTFCLNSRIKSIEDVGSRTDTDISTLVKTRRDSMTREEFRQLYNYMEYVPLCVYKVVRTGLSASRQWKYLCEKEGDPDFSKICASLQSDHKVHLLNGACKAGFDVGEIQKIMHLIKDVDTKSDIWASMLSRACECGHLQLVRYIFETRGTVHLDVNARVRLDDGGSSSALMLACKNGQIDIVKYLHETLGNLHTIYHQGTISFMLACRNGHTELVKYLYERIGDVDVNDRDYEGATAFMIACGEGHLDIAKYLYETVGDVDVNDEDDNGMTAFLLACERGKMDIVKYLYETVGDVDVNVVDDNGMTAFRCACMNGRVGIVKYLHETVGIADVNGVDVFGMTPFMMACERGQIDLIKYLAETIGNVNMGARDFEGRTAFMLACEYGDLGIVKYLHETIGKVDVNARSRYGGTALMMPIRSGNIDIVKYLYETVGNVDVNQKTRFGETALMRACAYGHMELVEYLVSRANADMHTSDAAGRTALDHAKRDDIVRYLSHEMSST